MSLTADLFKNLDSENLPIRILIVEDDPLIQLGLEQYLEEFPQFRIVGQAADGYMGIKKSYSLQPDLVIMDIGLPKLDGIAATQEIKATCGKTKIVMLTSHNTATEMMAALTSGADAYCIKGTTMTGLLAAIASATEGALYLDPQIARQAINCFSSTAKQSNNHQLSPRELEVLELSSRVILILKSQRDFM